MAGPGLESGEFESMNDIDVISLQYFSNFNKVRSLNFLLDTLQLVRLKKWYILREKNTTILYEC